MAARTHIDWDRVMSQLRAGHSLADIVKYTVGVTTSTITRRAAKDLPPGLLDEYYRLTLKNRMPAAGRRVQCGDKWGVHKHRRERTIACDACLKAAADQRRDYRRRSGKR